MYASVTAKKEKRCDVVVNESPFSATRTSTSPAGNCEKSGVMHVSSVCETKVPLTSIAPFFDELAEKYASARFVRVDVDELEEAAASARVTSMPTFQVVKHGKTEFTVTGADRSSLEAVVRRAVAFLA